MARTDCSSERESPLDKAIEKPTTVAMRSGTVITRCRSGVRRPAVSPNRSARSTFERASARAAQQSPKTTIRLRTDRERRSIQASPSALVMETTTEMSERSAKARERNANLKVRSVSGTSASTGKRFEIIDFATWSNNVAAAVTTRAPKRMRHLRAGCFCSSAGSSRSQNIHDAAARSPSGPTFPAKMNGGAESTMAATATTQRCSGTRDESIGDLMACDANTTIEGNAMAIPP
jgi:hypothetical protein